MKNKEQWHPSQVCSDCGMKARTEQGISRGTLTSTFHMDICDVCGEEKAVTEPRDFGYPKFEKVKAAKKNPIAKSLSSGLFKQRVVKSKKVYKRRTNAKLQDND